MNDWQVTDRDRELWHRELASFVPPRVLDAHVHLYELNQFQGQPPALCGSGPASAGWDVYQDRITELMPGRQIGAVCFGFPAIAIDIEAGNAFVAAECRSVAAGTGRPARGQMLIRPEMEPEFIRQQVRQGGFVGLKPYHVFASEKPTFDAHIPSFLPESHVRIAHEMGLSITLHIVRSRALADSSNQVVLRDYASKYPNARLILAHAARGFNPNHTIEGIHSLRGYDNVWFDTSAITDSGAIEAIVRSCGHRRVLYGSDFPVSHLRGRCVAVGDSFLWLSADNTKLDAAYADVQFELVGLESLRTLKVAAVSLGLTDAQIEDVFLHNATSLWEIKM